MLAFQRRAYRRTNHNRAARKPLADIIIRIAKHFERDPLAQERAQGLPRTSAQPHLDMILVQALHPV